MPASLSFAPTPSEFRHSPAAASGWADFIDMLTMHPEARRKVVQLLGEIDAEGKS